MARAADALHAAGDRGRCLNLNDEIDGAHVYAKLQRGGGAKGFDLTGLELLFNYGALICGKRAMVCADERFAGKIVERAGKTLRYLAAVDEKDGGPARANQLQQTRMNRIPQRNAARWLGFCAIGDDFGLGEARHVFHGNFYAELKALECACIDDGDGAVTD